MDSLILCWAPTSPGSNATKGSPAAGLSRSRPLATLDAVGKPLTRSTDTPRMVHHRGAAEAKPVSESKWPLRCPEVPNLANGDDGLLQPCRAGPTTGPRAASHWRSTTPQRTAARSRVYDLVSMAWHGVARHGMALHRHGVVEYV